MKKLTKDLTFEDFRREMQHRVVKYALNSRVVKEALRFAKLHDDPRFYRMATDKVHRQKQFEHETFGPSKFEKFVDIVSGSSIKEAVFMFALVLIGIIGVDYAKRAFFGSSQVAKIDEMDVDAIARKLGIRFEGSPEKKGETAPDKPGDRNQGPSAGKSKARAKSGNPTNDKSSVSQSNPPKQTTPHATKSQETKPATVELIKPATQPVTKPESKPETTQKQEASDSDLSDSPNGPDPTGNQKTTTKVNQPQSPKENK